MDPEKWNLETRKRILDVIVAKIEERAGTQYISIKELERALSEAFEMPVRIRPDQRYL